ncbi:MAG: ribosome small subunit-dependent GTPase A [Pirellulales bacterium]
MGKPRKYRVELRKNRGTRRRSGDLTRALDGNPDALADSAATERLSGKGELTRKRTIVEREPVNQSATGTGTAVWRGRILQVHGLESQVQAGDGRIVRCTTSRVLRNLSSAERHPVVAGDEVVVRTGGAGGADLIQGVEARRTVLCRSSRGQRHVIVANVTRVVIVASAAEPALKPGLVDRLLMAAESSGIPPLVCINKIDLVDRAGLVPLAGVYARMGYPVVLCSTRDGTGIERLRRAVAGRITAVVGQSGVGKSSILNAIEPGLGLAVAAVSRDTEKGKHTTTTARLIPLAEGGALVDTPGVRQFQLWRIVPAEVPAAFRDLRPFANRCRFPDCTHSHEADCAVKDAVADGLLDTRRWESCCHLAGSADDEEAA